MKNRQKLVISTAIVTTILLFGRNSWLYWSYSYAFYPDSSGYIQYGTSFFKDWRVDPLVTPDYIFLNSITSSYKSPVALLWLQISLGALAGGIFVYMLARHNLALSWICGSLFVFDLVWGAFARTLMTDGLFASFFLICLAVFISHYDRSGNIPPWELGLSGILYSWSCTFRPSHVFLLVLLPPLYLWLTHSWRKVIMLCGGILFFLALIGLVNWRGAKQFYILAPTNSFTNVYTAYPLFVYRLFSPENGPKSRQLDNIIQTCYPGLDYDLAVDRAVGGAVDSIKNMDFILKQLFPCVQNASISNNSNQGIFPKAYSESLLHRPVRFTQTILKENIVFLSYNNPYILRWQLAPAKNYGCAGISWCEQIHEGRAAWDGSSLFQKGYEKIATKLLQAYLAPVGLISRILPGHPDLVYSLSWFGMSLFLILGTRGRTRLLAMALLGLIQFTSLIVVLGFGFTERYAAMISPLQAALSGIAIFTLVEWALKFSHFLRRQGARSNYGT